MSKNIAGNQDSLITIADAPKRKKKPEEVPSKKLGLINKEKFKMRTFRLRIEAIDALQELTDKVNKKGNIRLPRTQVLEILLMDAAKSPAKILDIINSTTGNK
jgi:hypothetical protein